MGTSPYDLPSTRGGKRSHGKGALPAPNKEAAKAIYQLKVTLKESKPPIWRRIQVPGSITLAKLHRVLQVVMGWEDYHLHQYIVDDVYYGTRDPDFEAIGTETVNERGVKLYQIAPDVGSRFVYEYDFGDGWQHQIVVEKLLPAKAGATYPVCIAGKRACPPEDVGGVWGYSDFLQVIRNPSHSERDEMLEWAGGEFDPEAFDPDDINDALKQVR
ncbi:MAG: plasmid pRiA4b ORF-3 family protein [Chloroflexi bacterium]|nr:plasmid pRiA4b ORF-3 family protein [Chloroflexota bacterium]